MSEAIKGPGKPQEHFDGSNLRIAIVHARWNRKIIDALLAGAIAKLKERGVPESNITIQTVPGSFELPFACSKCVLTSSIPAYWLITRGQSYRRISCCPFWRKRRL